ncbi:MAG TPA: methyl-accepting chemotaxis protein [Candidatus Ozemobacteraceae bacterium]|nr:methyl-accepting chemotaxis protein [Candidatus Ozemobacteraceae bacterium]
MTQRKNYFIAKGMQSKFAGTILLLVFLITVITACNIYVLGSFFLTTQATLSEGQTAESMMRHFVTELWPRLLLLVLVNVIIVFIVSIMYSHQFAGPAYKLEKSIQRIASGDLTFEIHLRRNDSLKELATAINSMLSRFRDTLAQARALSDDVADKLGTVGKDEKFASLARSAAELRLMINQFKLVREGEPIEAVTESKTPSDQA